MKIQIFRIEHKLERVGPYRMARAHSDYIEVGNFIEHTFNSHAGPQDLIGEQSKQFHSWAKDLDCEHDRFNTTYHPTIRFAFRDIDSLFNWFKNNDRLFNLFKIHNYAIYIYEIHDYDCMPCGNHLAYNNYWSNLIEILEF